MIVNYQNNINQQNCLMSQNFLTQDHPSGN
jgi:hypothetical protein